MKSPKGTPYILQTANEFPNYAIGASLPDHVYARLEIAPGVADTETVRYVYAEGQEVTRTVEEIKRFIPLVTKIVDHVDTTITVDEIRLCL